MFSLSIFIRQPERFVPPRRFLLAIAVFPLPLPPARHAKRLLHVARTRYIVFEMRSVIRQIQSAEVITLGTAVRDVNRVKGCNANSTPHAPP